MGRVSILFRGLGIIRGRVFAKYELAEPPETAASWGRLGNQNINNYYNGSDVLSSGLNYSLGGTLYPGVAITTMTNKDITWKTAEQRNIGIDLNLKNGFGLTLDYFDKRTKDLLKTMPIPLTMALGNPYVNAGEVQNKGLEAALS